MAAPPDYKNRFLKKPPKRLAVVDQHGCSGCANSPACVAFCETVTVKDQIVDAIRYVRSPELPNNVAIIEYDKCIGCALCAEVCPWETITMCNFEEAWDVAEQVTLVEYSSDLDVYAEEKKAQPIAAAPVS
jgi:translation initiation factor RLI1